MAKAMICILDDNGNIDPEKKFEVMFNPPDYSTAVNITWAEEKEGKIPEFKQSNFDKFSVTLLFDTYEKGLDVRDDHESNTGGKGKIIGTRNLIELTFPIKPGVKTSNPPVCLFSWGKFNFKGFVEKVDQKFTMFSSDGIPVRATVTLTMKPVVDAQEMLKQKGVEACRKVRVVKEGERLDFIASVELKNPFLWRKIAEANNIYDPLNFPGPHDIGRILIIPD